MRVSPCVSPDDLDLRGGEIVIKPGHPVKRRKGVVRGRKNTDKVFGERLAGLAMGVIMLDPSLARTFRGMRDSSQQVLIENLQAVMVGELKDRKHEV